MCAPTLNAVHAKPEVVRAKDVQRILGISRSAAYRFLDENRPAGQQKPYLPVDVFAELTDISRERVKEALPTVEIN